MSDTDNIFLPVSTVRDGASTWKNWNTKRGLSSFKKRTETNLLVGVVRTPARIWSLIGHLVALNVGISGTKYQ